MSTDITNMTGVLRFNIKGREARLPWERKALKKAIVDGGGAPNDLRFQCQVARDAREVFKTIEIPGGGTLSIHQKAKPQFGRDGKGLPYLTVTLVDSRDGQSYKVRWSGEAVPRKMQELAVKHDEGRKVSATRVALRWEDAEITPSSHTDNTKRVGRKDVGPDGEVRLRPDGTKWGTRTRRYDRLCATDLTDGAA